MSTPPHPFDNAIALTPDGKSQFKGQPSEDYANMVGPFGGIIAATLLNAALSHTERLGEPVSLTVNFAAPIATAPYTVAARAVRTNRSTQHWIIELCQDDIALVTATAVFAVRRETWSSLEVTPPEARSSAEIEPMRGKGFPVWVKNYDMRFVCGGIFDGTTAGDSKSTVWLRDEPPRPLDFLSLAALSDAFFPRVFVKRQKMAPVGTITMTIYFHVDAALLEKQGTAEILATARAQRFRDGYFDQSAQLWGCDNELLVTTHQLVYYRDE